LGHISTQLVVIKTNVDIHMSAEGRYEDELMKRNGELLIAKRAGSSELGERRHA